MPIDGPADASSSSGVTAVPEQDLRSPDARDAALHRHKPATAPAAERYYSSHGPAQTITPTSVPVANTRDGIDPLPFVLGLAAALIVGVVAGSGLHTLFVRRRHATGLPA
jgi:hypothetical protein